MKKIYLLIMTLVLFFHVCADDNIVLKWNNATLEAIKINKTPPPMAARNLALVHTAMYDAWTAYDDVAFSTLFDGFCRRPKDERTLENKQKAISFAAYKVLLNLFPLISHQAFETLMIELGYDPNDNEYNMHTPSGIGNTVAFDLINFRKNDMSNQLGNDPNSKGTPYSDYTGYQPVNTFDHLNDPSKWQPLLVNGVVQTFLVPHWGLVVPFSLTNLAELTPNLLQYILKKKQGMKIKQDKYLKLN